MIDIIGLRGILVILGMEFQQGYGRNQRALVITMIWDQFPKGGEEYAKTRTILLSIAIGTFSFPLFIFFNF